jgi:hypothetical protein
MTKYSVFWIAASPRNGEETGIPDRLGWKPIASIGEIPDLLLQCHMGNLDWDL